jgi:hypothetical protein
MIHKLCFSKSKGIALISLNKNYKYHKKHLNTLGWEMFEQTVSTCMAVLREEFSSFHTLSYSKPSESKFRCFKDDSGAMMREHSLQPRLWHKAFPDSTANSAFSRMRSKQTLESAVSGSVNFTQ